MDVGDAGKEEPLDVACGVARDGEEQTRFRDFESGEVMSETE